MPLYHFDPVNTQTLIDTGRANLHDDIDALDIADAVGRHILHKQLQLQPGVSKPGS